LDISAGNKHAIYILHNGSDKGTERASGCELDSYGLGKK